MDENDSQESCETNLLEDIPALADHFSTGSFRGAHTRLAQAISELLLQSRGGKIISIEGKWGSGKSTVINLIKGRLQTEANVRLFAFDAWAHSGDPLRLAFLDGITRFLCGCGWIKKWEGEDGWGEKLERLSKRKRETTTISTPKLTRVGAFLVASLFAVPVGSALMEQGLEGGISISLSDRVATTFLIGLALTLLPIIAAIATRSKRLASSVTESFAVLSGQHGTVTASEEALTPDPSSIEFEAYFRDLIAEALDPQERRLVIVMDNLDRVRSNELTSIWTTLQAFTRIGGGEPNEWNHRYWVLVPFDPSEIYSLWPNDFVEREHSQQLQNELLDKSFQARFELPLPISSDWRSLLQALLRRALPKHENEAEKVSSLYAVVNPSRDPSPRELTAIVNQIGALHRQWPKHEFGFSHMAYFVLLRRNSIDIASRLLHQNSMDVRAEPLLGDGYRESLAALAFNVEPERGMQTLLAEPIFSAIISGDSEALAKLARVHPPGFWGVIPKLYPRIQDMEDAVVPAAVRAIVNCEVLFEHGNSPGLLLTNVLEKTLRVQTWHFSGEQNGRSLAKLVALTHRLETLAVFEDAISREILAEDVTNADDGVELGGIRAAVGFGDELRNSGLSLSSPFQHGSTGSRWLENIAQLKSMTDSATAKEMQPKLPRSELIATVKERLIEGKPAHLLAAVVSLPGGSRDEWSEVLTAAWDSLSVEADPKLLATAIAIILHLDNGVGRRDSGSPDVLEEIASVVNVWANPHLTSASQLSTYAFALMVAYAPNLPNEAPSAVNGTVAHKFVHDFLKVDEAEYVDGAIKRINRFGLRSLFLAFEANRVNWDKLSTAILRRLFGVESFWTDDALSYVLRVWANGFLEEVFEGSEAEFTPFLEHMSKTNGFRVLKEHGFDKGLLSLYEKVMATDSGLALSAWLLEELGRLDQEEFVEIISDDQVLDEFVAIWAKLEARHPSASGLPVAYLDAIVELFKSARDAEKPTPDRIIKAARILGEGHQLDLAKHQASIFLDGSNVDSLIPYLKVSSRLIDALLAHPGLPDLLKEVFESANATSLAWLADLVEGATATQVRQLRKGAMKQRLAQAIETGGDEHVVEALRRIDKRIRPS